MAAFHFSVKIHSRSEGRSAVRSAAYRAAERLYDIRAGRTEDYTNKHDVLETAILAPVGSPAWVQDRNELWNRAEAAERRRDSQVAQELEINLPRELGEDANWQLICDFAREHLVGHGRICDIAFHLGTASDGRAHPHVHILMPTRELTGESFGEKHPDCSWKTFVKRRDRLNELRETWCDFARARALEHEIDLGPEWDHRSFETRGIDLEPQPKRGATAQRIDRERDQTQAQARAGAGATTGNAAEAKRKAERTEEVLAVQRRNGAALLRDPSIALEALTQRHSTFSDADLARYIFQHSAQDQFAAIMAKAQPLCVMVGNDDDGYPRLSTPAMVALEARMVAEAATLAQTETHTVPQRQATGLRNHGLSAEQAQAAGHLVTGGDLACLTGYAGSGKSTLLGAARAAWEAAGYRVRGAALSGIAAEGLRSGSGIEARTIASLNHAWNRNTEPLTARDVLVIDEAGMVGSRELAGLIARCRDAGAKLVLVGDPEQLQAIDAGAAYRAVAERVGTQTLTEIWRQRTDWQRGATRALAERQTAAALDRYRTAGCIESCGRDADARLRLVERWAADREAQPDASRIMLTYKNDDVRQLNAAARDLLRSEGQLGLDEVVVDTNFGARAFATGDRLIFRRNDRTMDVRNGTIGTVTELGDGSLSVRLDDGRVVAFDPTIYKDIDHGFAVTCHRAQGVTVDRAFVLATPLFDRHTTYVACTRHRESLTLVHSREAFKTDVQLARRLGRRRAKDTTLDYGEAHACDEHDAALGDGSASDRNTSDWTPVWPAAPAPAPKPTDDFIRAHQPAPEPARRAAPRSAQDHAHESAPQPAPKPAHGPSEVEQMLKAWADRAVDPERPWEHRPKDRGWGL